MTLLHLHFTHQGSRLYVIPSSPQHNLYVIDVDDKFYDVVQTKRHAICFSGVLSASRHIVGLGDTLQAVLS